MQKAKVFKVDDKPITVKELTVKDVLLLFNQKKGLSFESLLDESFLPMASNLTIDELKEFSFSELETIWEHFKEVNSVFFKLVRATGMEKILNELKETAMQDFLALYARLRKQDTPEL